MKHEVSTSTCPISVLVPSWASDTISLGDYTPNSNTPKIALNIMVYHLVWATELLLAAIVLIFPALVLGYNFFIVESTVGFTIFPYIVALVHKKTYVDHYWVD